MDLDNLSFFKMAKARMDWAAERQQVLSQNVANADSPRYQPRDIKSPNFKALVHALRNPQQVKATMTDPRHLPGTLPERGTYRVEEVKRAYETSPDGNGIVLEDQMSRISETRSTYEVTMNLYQKQLKMIRHALGRGN